MTHDEQVAFLAEEKRLADTYGHLTLLETFKELDELARLRRAWQPMLVALKMAELADDLALNGSPLMLQYRQRADKLRKAALKLAGEAK